MKRRTFIFCKEDHVVGEIVYKTLRGDTVSALWLYEVSIMQSEIPSELMKKRGISFGDATYECTICHSEVDWQPSNTTVVKTVVSLLNTLYEPAARRDRVRYGNKEKVSS